ncbi:MAG: tripartite-type tricarboxylate transporter receptor subunit TctC [Moritella dasanensis]|jgi:tripartite-type tricarboxylate transporter receptor subunit TctC
MIETAARQQDTLMVNSTPIVIRSLTGIFPQSFRELTPVATTIADYGAIVVAADSKFENWSSTYSCHHSTRTFSRSAKCTDAYRDGQQCVIVMVGLITTEQIKTFMHS